MQSPGVYKGVAQHDPTLDQNEAALRKESELFGEDIVPLWQFRVHYTRDLLDRVKIRGFCGSPLEFTVRNAAIIRYHGCEAECEGDFSFMCFHPPVTQSKV